MNNNYISNSSVGPTVSKSSRYYGLPYSKQAPGSPQTPQDQARPHKIQVLKPIINYKHNASKVIGIDMSQEEYFFYKPILGGRRLSNKNGEQGSPAHSPAGKKENQQPLHHNSSNINSQASSISKDIQQSKILHGHMSHMNSNHLSPKAIITNSILQNQKNISSYSPSAHAGLNDGSNSSHKVNYIQNYTPNSQPMTQRFLHDENHNSNKPYQQQQNGSKGIEKENSSSQMTARGGQTFDHQQSPNTSRYTSNISSRPSLSKKDMTGTTAPTMHEDSSSLQLQKNQVLNFENTKQLNNNPLKDISNRVVNQVYHQQNLGPKSSTPSFETQSQAVKNRYTMPFEIAPTNSTSGQKNLKINNYLDQPFKQITPQVKNDHQRSHIQDSQSPFSQADHHQQNRYDKGIKVTNFEEQSKYPSGKAKVPTNGYFEKKRLSDNTMKSNNGPSALDEKYKIEEEVIREIFDKKEKQRKGHNISVTTNTSTTSTTTNRKSNVNTYGQYGNASTTNLNATGRKSHTNSKTSSVNQTPQHQNTSQATLPTSVSSLQSQLMSLEKMLNQVMESIRRKSKPTFSLNETSKTIQEVNRQVRSLLNDSSLEFLLRQHTRTQYISLAFVRALEDDLIAGGARSNDNLQAILMNALDYIKKNLKSFSEIIENSANNAINGKNNKGSKKDLNSNPFGVMGPGGSRNGANKENYGGNSNTTNKNIGSKSEKKMFIKQNIQIALAFLKKICRLTKINQDKFKDFLQILNQIESGTQTSKVKEQIKRALHQIRNDSKSLLNTQSTISFSQTQKNFLNQSSRKHQRRESMTIEIDDEVTSHSIPFGFADLKEVENEESTEENLQTLNSNSPRKIELVTLDRLDNGKNESKKLLENPYPNLLEQQPGRLSLQPQPLAGLKLGPGTPKMERIEALQTDYLSPDQKENQQPPSQGGPTVTNSPQLSIVTKKHANRISNTHEPITVRGARPSHRIRFDEEDKLQTCLAPAHINARSSSLPSREPYLPADIAKGYEYTLVLDLDETLVHFDPKIRTYRPRPGVLKFLNEMSKYYELVVFTAGLKDYADWILNDFDRQNYITHRLYRDHTKYRNGVYVKDLSKLGRDMSKIIIIDNIEENFQAQPDNGIPIKGWYHDQNDKELDKYAPFLKRLVVNRITDVRPEVKQFKAQFSSGHSFIQHHTVTINNNGSTTTTTTNANQYVSGATSNRNNYNHHYGGAAANKHLQPWGSDTESEKDKTSEEEEDESSEEETIPQKKKAVATKKKQESSEEEEDESDKEEDSDEEESTVKQKVVVAKKKQVSSDEEEESEAEDSDDNDKKSKVTAKPQPQSQDSKDLAEALKQIKDLEAQMEQMQEDMAQKDEELEKRQANIAKQSKKMLKMDQEQSELRDDIRTRDDTIQSKLTFIEDLESQLTDKNSVIAVQQSQITDLSKSNLIIDGLNKQLSQKHEEIGILKAKLYLDMIAMNIKVVAEYPDMVEENNQLHESVAQKVREIDSIQGQLDELERHIKGQDEELKNREKRNREHVKDKEGLNKTIKELQVNKKQLLEIQKIHETQIQQLEHQVQLKNDELEQRLENISKLIQKNEQLNQQVRIQKQRMEKFKTDQVSGYQKDLSDKLSEIEVLKEMVKGNQLQLRAKEKELVRFKQRVLQLEGAQLAQRQQQNMAMNMTPNNAQLNPNAKRTLGQLKNAPQRYQQAPQSMSSKLQSVNSSKSYFPPLDHRSQGGDQYSQYSGKSMNNRGDGSKERQTRITPNNKGLDSQGNIRNTLSKRIVEEADAEIENSNSVGRRVQQQHFVQNQKSQGSKLPPQLSNEDYIQSNVFSLANVVREVVQQENDELDADEHHHSVASAVLRMSQKSGAQFSLNQDLTPITQNQNQHQRESLVGLDDQYQEQEEGSDEEEEQQHQQQMHDEEEYE